jgi:hypothetical protein
VISWLVKHNLWVPEWLFQRWVDKQLRAKGYS